MKPALCFCHGATTDTVSESLDYAMDLALELGLICHPAKTLLRAQTQKLYGLLYETQDVPVQKVPTNKVSRALALLSFVWREGNGPISRLGLSVLLGSSSRSFQPPRATSVSIF